MSREAPPRRSVEVEIRHYDERYRAVRFFDSGGIGQMWTDDAEAAVGDYLKSIVDAAIEQGYEETKPS